MTITRTELNALTNRVAGIAVTLAEIEAELAAPTPDGDALRLRVAALGEQIGETDDQIKAAAAAIAAMERSAE